MRSIQILGFIFVASLCFLNAESVDAKMLQATGDSTQEVARTSVHKGDMEVIKKATCDEAKKTAEANAVASCKHNVKGVWSGVTKLTVARGEEFGTFRPIWEIYCSAIATVECSWL